MRFEKFEVFGSKRNVAKGMGFDPANLTKTQFTQVNSRHRMQAASSYSGSEGGSDINLRFGGSAKSEDYGYIITD